MCFGGVFCLGVFLEGFWFGVVFGCVVGFVFGWGVFWVFFLGGGRVFGVFRAMGPNGLVKELTTEYER